MRSELGHSSTPSPRKPQLPFQASRLLKVDIAALLTCDEPDAVLVSYSLGSCIAVTAHDPIRRVAGMLQFMLPTAESSPKKAKDHPAMFGDTGFPLLLAQMTAAGCRRENLIIKAVGGGTLCNSPGVFDLGSRNQAVLAEMCAQHGIGLAAGDLGGTRSRTVHMQVASGRLIVSAQGLEAEL